MTLAMTLVTKSGVWASVDNRLTDMRSGRVIVDNSVKHVITQSNRGACLITYTGLGRYGDLEISKWVREVVRGPWLPPVNLMVDLAKQASLNFGPTLSQAKVEHVFLAGGFAGGRAYAIEVTNRRSATPLHDEFIEPEFKTYVDEVDSCRLAIVGGGATAVSEDDRAMLNTVAMRRPRRPEDFMKLLADINARAARSRRPGYKTISESSTVSYLPSTGEPAQSKWFGPEDKRPPHLSTLSYVNSGLDLSAWLNPILDATERLFADEMSEDQLRQVFQEASRRASEPFGRRTPPAS